MDESDDGLVLNLNVSGSGFSTSTKRKHGRKKYEKRASQGRFKRHRPLNKKGKLVKVRPTKTIDNQSVHDDIHSGKKLKIKPHKATSVYLDNETRRSTDDSFQVISSLFSKNPEIPDIQATRPVKQATYQLFSEAPVNETDLSDRLLKALKDRLGFETFTEVQNDAIPAFLSNSDVLIKSPTGSGKTLAYALPLIQRLQQIRPKISRTDGPYAVILLPTRELAVQSYEVFEALCRTFVWIVPGLIVGGEKRKAEKSRIRKGINIVIATPGRLLDHLNTTKSLSLKNLLVLIFDEADRLLDMGFAQTVSQILSRIKEHCNRKIQTGLLSATLNPKVENLASISLESPVLLDMSIKGNKVTEEKLDNGKIVVCDDLETDIGAVEGKTELEQKFQTPSTLKQYFVIVPAKLRLVCLISFLVKFGFRNENGKIIVFFSSKSSTELHCHLLESEVVKEHILSTQSEVYKLHGDMIPKERNEVFRKFKRCKKGILLSTDVAARGLDLPRVNWIVQYSCPTQIEDYIHRVGRTARIGSEGEALLFLLPSEVKYISALEAKNIEIKKLGLFDILKYLDPKSGKKYNQCSIERLATDVQNKLELLLDGNHDLKTVAENAFRSFIQAYAAYPSHLKEIFHVKRLHLGHIAKSFALRAAPREMKNLSLSGEKIIKKKEKGVELKRRKRKGLDMSETGGGVIINGPRPGGKNSKRKRKN